MTKSLKLDNKIFRSSKFLSSEQHREFVRLVKLLEEDESHIVLLDIKVVNGLITVEETNNNAHNQLFLTSTWRYNYDHGDLTIRWDSEREETEILKGHPIFHILDYLRRVNAEIAEAKKRQMKLWIEKNREE